MTNFELSPDEKKLAYEYYPSSSFYLKIKNLETAAEELIPIEGHDGIGNITWSPDQEQIVLSAWNGSGWDAFIAYTALIDLKTTSTTILYENPEEMIWSYEWLSGEEIAAYTDDNAASII